MPTPTSIPMVPAPQIQGPENPADSTAAPQYARHTRQSCRMLPSAATVYRCMCVSLDRVSGDDACSKAARSSTVLPRQRTS